MSYILGAANLRERTRMRVLSKGFAKLKLMLPWVPPDTKLSKLDTLRLATSYISHLQRVLDDNGDEYSSGNDTKYQTPSLVRNLLFLTVRSTFAVTDEKKLRSTNLEIPKDRLFISNCFKLPSDRLSQ